MEQLDRLTRQVRYGVQLASAAWPKFMRPLALELASHQPIREVLPDLWHWTAIHPKIRVPVDSYYIESARVVLDPMVPREGLEWFEGRETPSQIVLTNRHHLRHSERYAEAFGCPVRCSEAGLHEFERGPKVEGFAFGRNWRRGSPHINWERSARTIPRCTSAPVTAARSRSPTASRARAAAGLRSCPGS